jgi:hypothetical protein
VRYQLVVAPLLLAGCGDGTAPEDATAPLPVIETASVEANRNNALSAVVAVRAREADSVSVRFRLATASAAIESATPAVAMQDGEAAVPVLGLLPGQTYVLRVVAFGPGGVHEGSELSFSTGLLPSDLPRYGAGGLAPSPGYVAFGAGRYGLVIDNTGRVVWYRRFEPAGPGLNFQAQPNGRYIGLPPTPDSTDAEVFIEVDQLGEETRRLGCAGGLRPRFHDLLVEPEGSYWIMCDETRVTDLTAVGGQAAARVTGTVIQHIGPTGDLVFQWSPWDHFDVTDLDSPAAPAPTSGLMATRWTSMRPAIFSCRFAA